MSLRRVLVGTRLAEAERRARRVRDGGRDRDRTC